MRLACLMLALLSMSPSAQIRVDVDAQGAGDGTSWADAFTDLALALSSASGAASVWVAEGVYRPSDSGDRSATFLVPTNVSLYGGFDGTESALSQRAGLFDTTILSGDLLGDDLPGFVNTDDNSYHVVTNDAFIHTVDGFTVEGGHAEGSDGGGIYGPSLGGALIQNCTFRHNQADGRGGAGFLVPGDSMVVRGCTFEGNRAAGSGGGFWTNYIDSPATFESCRFIGNEAGDLGGGLSASYAHVVGCAFLGNAVHGGQGGGAIGGGGILLVNATLWRNTAFGASAGGGGLFVDTLVMENSIVWGNLDDDGSGEASQIRLLAPFASVDAGSSCIQGWTGTLDDGLGNVLGDPRFVDRLGADGVAGTADDDLRLGVGSPCVDTGLLPTAVPLPPVDVAGRPRLVDAYLDDLGGVVDMGAHERRPGDGTAVFCGQPPTSLGVPAGIVAPAVFSVASGPLRLAAGPVPAEGGLFAIAAEPGPPGSGTCLGGAPVHLLPAIAVAGRLSLTLEPADLQALGLLPGTTWYAQAWFTDGATRGASSATAITLLE